MIVNRLLDEKNMTKYRLSKISGVPQTTISDICSGKTQIEKCSADTIYKISKALDVSMESLIEAEINKEKPLDYRSSFQTFKSNICHYVKDKGDIKFIVDALKLDEVSKLYNKKWYPEALYLLAMIDYLSRENNLSLYTKYDYLRNARFVSPIYSTSVIAASLLTKDDRFKKEAYAEAIPEFLRHNIVEGEVRDVY